MASIPHMETSGKPRIPGEAEAGSMLDYALRYAELGWQVFPVHSIMDGACTCKSADCDRPGKHPIYQLVRDGLNSASDNPDLIKAWWSNAQWANIGVRTGPESGIWVLDVDTADGKQGAESLDALQTKHGNIPDTVEAITGSGGRHLIFSYPSNHRISNSTNRLGPGLDIRGAGGYIIVEPSLHNSGQAYAWEGSSDPLEDVAPVGAPLWLLDLLHEQGGTPAANQATGPAIDARQVLELRQAMGYLDPDDYHTWVQVGMALQSSGAGNQAFGLWCEWATGSDKFDTKASRKKWGSFCDKSAGVQLASIFAWAQAQGWVNPASREAQAFEAATGMTIEQANKRQPMPEVIVPERAGVEPFPVPGLDEVCGWIEAGAPVSYPVVTQHAALCLASAAASRLYVTPQGDPLSLYLGAAGRSVGELRYAHQAIYRALSDAGLRRMVRTTRFTSPQTIYKTLMRSPASVYLSDDYGGMSAFARRQPSGLQEQALATLAGIHGGAPVQLDSPEEAGLKQSSVGDDQPVIQGPSLSMFALVGWDHLVTLLRASELGRGALEQILLALGDDDDSQTRDPVDAPPPAWLPAHLQGIRRVPNGSHVDLDLGTIFQSNAELLPAQTVVTFPPLTGAYEALDAVSQDRRVRPLLLAARGTMRRVAATLAVWRDPARPVVDGPILEWAGRYVRARMADLVEQFETLHGDDGRITPYDAVLTRVQEAKHTGLARRDLIIGCKPFRNLASEKRGELIEQMLSDEMVFEITVKPKGRGRPGKRLVAAKYVMREAGDEA
jgi:hypothetical protein